MDLEILSNIKTEEETLQTNCQWKESTSF